MSFPEELLEAILARAVLIPEAELLHREMSVSKAPHTSLLRVNHTWNRIALPLFYRTVILHSDDATKLWLRSLIENPALGPFVRNICFANPEPGSTLAGIPSALGPHRIDTVRIFSRSNMYWLLTCPCSFICLSEASSTATRASILHNGRIQSLAISVRDK